MKRGDIVRHKLSEETYRILKMGENVAVCQCPPYSTKIVADWMHWDSYTCNIENLELHPEGKEIFDWLDSFGENAYTKLLKPEVKPGTQLSLI